MWVDHPSPRRTGDGEVIFGPGKLASGMYWPRMKHGSNTDQRGEAFFSTNCGEAACVSLESLTPTLGHV